MNKFNTKGSVKGKSNMNKLNTVFYNTVIAMLLASTSFAANANRPAMEEAAANITQEKIQQEKMQQMQQRQAEAAQQASQQASQQTSQQTPGSSVDRIIQRQPTSNVQHQTTGDTLVLPPKEMRTGETINIKKLNTPRRGVKMDAVRRELGSPIATSASVGQPPITHWTYKDRIVYFEHSTVLHVVAR